MILRSLRRTASVCTGGLSLQTCLSARQAETISCVAAYLHHAEEQGPVWHKARQDVRAFHAVPSLHDASSGSSEQPSSSAGNKDMIAVFTCAKCDTRSAKPFSKHSYEKGVVIVQCPGCKGRHLLADRLGWFGEDGSIEETLARHGKDVKRVTTRDDGTLEVTLDDIVGQDNRQDNGKEAR